jgi:hypothetical protein
LTWADYNLALQVYSGSALAIPISMSANELLTVIYFPPFLLLLPLITAGTCPSPSAAAAWAGTWVAGLAASCPGTSSGPEDTSVASRPSAPFLAGTSEAACSDRRSREAPWAAGRTVAVLPHSDRSLPDRRSPATTCAHLRTSLPPRRTYHLRTCCPCSSR